MQLPAYSRRKLAPRWLGPFAILQKMGEMAYELQLPAHMKIHPVFHVALLRRWKGPPPEIPSPILVKGQEEWEV